MKTPKEQEMIGLYAKWQQSGKTKKAFCQEEGVNKSTFYYWIKKCQAPAFTVKKKEPGFTPLVVAQNNSFNGQQPIVRINYNTGVSIDFFQAVDAGYIKNLCQ